MALVGPHHIDRSSLTFYSTTVLALIAKVTSTSITTTLATTALVGKSTFSLAIAASIFEIFSLATLLAAIGLFLRRVSRRLILAVWIPGTIACLIGSILAITTLSSALQFKRTSTSNDVGPAEQYTRDLAGAGLAAAVIGLIPQGALWAIIWPRKVQNSVLPVEQLLPDQQVKQRTISLHLGSIGLKPGKAIFGAQHEPTSPMSPSYSQFTASGRSSLRNSASQSLRPMTSKTRLILQTSFGPRSSRGTQPDTGIATHPTRSTDEFEHWDTSRVKSSFETSYQKKAAVPRLEPIPGSRPVSPAHPLDGPFGGEAEPEEASVAVAQPQATTNADIEKGSLRNLPRLHTRRGSTPSIASPTSPTTDQHFIHPLFRSESPNPPPATSPGTVITASPYAGQIFSPEFALQSPRLLGSRDGSRPVSPALLSPIRSRPGSVKSYRTVPPSPIEGPHEPLPDRSFSRLVGKQSRPGTPLSPNG
ncbi:hypothetical protein Slin14017_G117460 [Septoria linicola]|nr:hypothetical protein Slin14017_G117460 [Septoria linicola]